MDFDKWKLWKSVAICVSCLKAIIMIRIIFYISHGVFTVSQWGSKEGYYVVQSLLRFTQCCVGNPPSLSVLSWYIKCTVRRGFTFTLQLPNVMVKLIMPRKRNEHMCLKLVVRISEWPKVLGVNGTVLVSLPGAWDNPG